MDNDTQTLDRPTGAWLVFSYASFAASLALVGGGIIMLTQDWWTKGYFVMGAVMLVQSCFTLAKNLRDVHEASRFINRLETARTEKLLAGR